MDSDHSPSSPFDSLKQVIGQSPDSVENHSLAEAPRQFVEDHLHHAEGVNSGRLSPDHGGSHFMEPSPTSAAVPVGSLIDDYSAQSANELVEESLAFLGDQAPDLLRDSNAMSASGDTGSSESGDFVKVERPQDFGMSPPLEDAASPTFDQPAAAQRHLEGGPFGDSPSPTIGHVPAVHPQFTESFDQVITPSDDVERPVGDDLKDFGLPSPQDMTSSSVQQSMQSFMSDMTSSNKPEDPYQNRSGGFSPDEDRSPVSPSADPSRDITRTDIPRESDETADLLSEAAEEDMFNNQRFSSTDRPLQAKPAADAMNQLSDFLGGDSPPSPAEEVAPFVTSHSDNLMADIEYDIPSPAIPSIRTTSFGSSDVDPVPDFVARPPTPPKRIEEEMEHNDPEPPIIDINFRHAERRASNAAAYNGFKLTRDPKGCFTGGKSPSEMIAGDGASSGRD